MGYFKFNILKYKFIFSATNSERKFRVLLREVEIITQERWFLISGNISTFLGDILGLLQYSDNAF
ncbi:hypothetical protein [Mycoplasmopsis bovirhinis]|uniref:hypothetical protein n=1 Tax=Mycoplasmopsis bovirhinis TaxID=29553 RepID=UPI00101D724F|nr:hypothetical protein [Mycoplasmopsis bovirhinis]